jgi:cytoskeletal protein RodZ
MAGIGSTLREARERANLDIMDFEVRTKIRAKYLRAMEDEEWSLLPGYTFTKGFLRTYADMLGLDGRALVDEFKRQYRDPSELELAPAAPTRHGDRARRARERPRNEARDRPAERAGRPSRGGRPPIVVAVVVLVVLLAAALYAVGVLAGKKSPAPPVRTLTTNTTGSSTKKRHRHRKPSHKPTTVAKVVSLRLAPTGPDYVCLIGYPGS